MDREIRNIVLIGSGNVAWHLVNACIHSDISVVQILAHNEITAQNLSKNFSVPFVTDPSLLVKDADLYLMAVQDDRIKETAARLGLTDQLLAHTSGYSSIDTLSVFSSNTGVLWPLQTLTAGKEIEYSTIPFFIEGNTNENRGRLKRFAAMVSHRVIIADSPTRQKTHLAAVIASNLTNQLYSISASILERQDIPFDVLAPLILETAQKAGQQHPLLSQTGPAVRKDLQVIAQHLELLRDDPSFRDIYRLITENIIHHHHKRNE